MVHAGAGTGAGMVSAGAKAEASLGAAIEAQRAAQRARDSLEPLGGAGVCGTVYEGLLEWHAANLEFSMGAPLGEALPSASSAHCHPCCVCYRPITPPACFNRL